MFWLRNIEIVLEVLGQKMSKIMCSSSQIGQSHMSLLSCMCCEVCVDFMSRSKSLMGQIKFWCGSKILGVVECVCRNLRLFFLDFCNFSLHELLKYIFPKRNTAKYRLNLLDLQLVLVLNTE